jgi:hypothetical protein
MPYYYACFQCIKKDSNAVKTGVAAMPAVKIYYSMYIINIKHTSNQPPLSRGNIVCVSETLFSQSRPKHYLPGNFPELGCLRDYQRLRIQTGIKTNGIPDLHGERPSLRAGTASRRNVARLTAREDPVFSTIPDPLGGLRALDRMLAIRFGTALSL